MHLVAAVVYIALVIGVSQSSNRAVNRIVFLESTFFEFHRPIRTATVIQPKVLHVSPFEITEITHDQTTIKQLAHVQPLWLSVSRPESVDLTLTRMKRQLLPQATSKVRR